MKAARFSISTFVLFFSLLAGGCGNQPTLEPVSIEVQPTATSKAVQPPAAEPSVSETATSIPQIAPGPFTLISPVFNDGEEMSDKYAYQMGEQCSGENYSPALEWTGIPTGTQSFAVTVIDPDGGNWVHWIQFNIPADATSLPEAIGGPDVGIKGKNDFGSNGYGGPCPPGGTHRYVFTLYALDTTLDLQAGAKLNDLQAALEGHILAETQLTGLRTR